ncbi:MAG TPA: hypothetical protein PKA95_10895, partial [Thermomicrobiales bacterium]|nr:hypothetical protein [Thermomicrobiales bacterium]
GFAIGGVLGDAIGLVPVLSASALVRVLGGLVALAFLPRGEGVAEPDLTLAEMEVVPEAEG